MGRIPVSVIIGAVVSLVVGAVCIGFFVRGKTIDSLNEQLATAKTDIVAARAQAQALAESNKNMVAALDDAAKTAAEKRRNLDAAVDAEPDWSKQALPDKIKGALK